MNKEDIIPKYFEANLAFYNFLNSHGLFDTTDYVSALLAPGYLRAVKLSIISNMFLLIKESIISKERNNKIFMEQLDKIVLTITKKVNDKYFLDDIVFNNPMEVVAFIRNNLAHGLYLIDFDLSEVILIDGSSKKEARVSIDKLSIFVISGILGYLDDEISSSITRRIIRNMDLDVNRRKPLNSEMEVLNMIKKFSVISINIKKKDGNYISLDDRLFFDDEIEHFGKVKNKGVLEILREKMKDKYEITYSDSNVDEDTARKIAQQVFSLVGDMTDYQEQARVILFQTEKIISSDKMVGYTNTIKLLNAIFRAGTTEWECVLDKVDGELLIDYDVFADSELGMFNALFIYGMDDILNDDNVINNMIIEKFDYSMLDLSLIKINNINFEKGQIKSLREECISVNKKLKNKKNNIVDDVLRDVPDNEKQKNILGTYSEISEEIMSLEKRKEVLDKKIKYYDSNCGVGKYFYNKAIIEGIRNSMAHGNYQIKFDDKLNTPKIIFKSIFKEVEVFSCEVSIYDFAKVLYDASLVVNEYLESIKDKNFKKK